LERRPGAAKHPIDPAWTRRLQPLGAAAGQQRLPQPLLAQLERADLLGQPARKLVLVADGALAKPSALRICARCRSIERPDQS
jgi:hypothetical protein